MHNAPMEWIVTPANSGRWPMLVLGSGRYLELLEMLARDAVDWRYDIDIAKKRGPRGHPGYFCYWGKGTEPLTMEAVRERAMKAANANFFAAYADGSVLRVNLIFRRWKALGTVPASTARSRAEEAGTFVAQNARWWPSFRAAGWLFFTAWSLGLLLLLMVLVTPWFLVGALAAFFVAYALIRPHTGQSICDNFAPLPSRAITFSPINGTAAAGAVVLVVLTALVTRWLGG